mgnify:CR=1 FL=1
MKYLPFRTLLLIQFSVLFSQPVPSYNIISQSRELLFDAGENWELLSIFGPIRFKNKQQKDKKTILKMEGIIGLNNKNNIYSAYYSGHFDFKNNYYGYSYPKLNIKTYQYKTGKILADYTRMGKNLSGIGFQNNWVCLQISTGQQSWGAGNDIELALSNNSSAFDYFLLASDYGKVRVRYVHGFLEKIQENINRYITARGFEWTNKKSLIIGFSETVIYSGENRPIDIGYLNPISSHIEIELNNRLNIIGEKNANAVWQLHFDWMLNKRTRFSANYLFDELVLDPKIEIGKEHGKAYSLRLGYTPLFSSNHLLSLYSRIVHIGTPTFRHAVGANNFVQNGRPLGWQKGSDGKDISIGLNYFNQKNIRFSFLTGFFETGDENILNRVFDSYSDYLKGSFPSGEIYKTIYFDTFIRYWWKPYVSILSGLNWSDNIENHNSLDLRFNIQIFHTFSTNF